MKLKYTLFYALALSSCSEKDEFMVSPRPKDMSFYVIAKS